MEATALTPRSGLISTPKPVTPTWPKWYLQYEDDTELARYKFYAIFSYLIEISKKTQC